MNKYRNIPTVIDGIRFDSRKESTRYTELKLLERAKMITNLQLQPKYPVNVNGSYIGFYKGDFQYTDKDGQLIVEDVKGVRTALFKWKKKLVEAIHGVKILEL